MRDAFFRALLRLAENDERVMLVVGDVGFGVAEPFARAYPRRFLNAGVAEQNMTSVAAGMALTGKVVFTYSIANFPTIRCLEQVRNDVCYHNANVKIVAVGGGYGYGALGATHHATEDLAIMRALPNMVVVAPGDPVEAAEATLAVGAHPGPCYLRLGRAGEKTVHQRSIDFRLGRAIQVRESEGEAESEGESESESEDLTLISTGAMLPTAVYAAEELEKDGFAVRVLSMHTVKPLDSDAVLAAARQTGMIVTLEEHSIIGGLGAAVAEVLAENDGAGVGFRRLGLASQFATQVGSQEYLRAQAGLSPEAVLQSLRSLLDKRRRQKSVVAGSRA